MRHSWNLRGFVHMTCPSMKGSLLNLSSRGTVAFAASDSSSLTHFSHIPHLTHFPHPSPLTAPNSTRPIQAAARRTAHKAGLVAAQTHSTSSAFRALPAGSGIPGAHTRGGRGRGGERSTAHCAERSDCGGVVERRTGKGDRRIGGVQCVTPGTEAFSVWSEKRETGMGRETDTEREAEMKRGIEMKRERGYEREMNAAIDAVGRACLLAIEVQKEMRASSEGSAVREGVVEKRDRTPVTVADYAIQTLITLELQSAFPGVPLLGEEDSCELLTAHDSAAGSHSLLTRLVSLTRAFCSPDIAQNINETVVLEALGAAPTEDDPNGHLDEEKSAFGPQPASPYWILDPIDGTRGFLQGGTAQYVVGLALVIGDQVVLGVMGLPNMVYSPDSAKQKNSETGGQSERGLLIGAVEGGGCWVRPIKQISSTQASEEPGQDQLQGNLPSSSVHPWQGSGFIKCRVDVAPRVSDGIVCISDHEQWDDLPLSKGLQQSPGFLEHGQPTVQHLCCGSLCKYAAVALGRASVFIQHPTPLGSCKPLKVWDHAAGVICVVEAGGMVTDFDGCNIELGQAQQTFLPGKGGVVVSNNHVHEEVLKLICEEV